LFNLKDYDGNIRKDISSHLNENLFKEEILKQVQNNGSIQLDFFPEKEIYKLSTEISPMSHIKMLEAFQKFTDEAVSKTINLPKNITKQEIQNLFLYVLNNKYLKGISIYKDGSYNKQPISLQ
jgi:ribonucleoside-diphosphate reductase alpha chain